MNHKKNGTRNGGRVPKSDPLPRRYTLAKSPVRSQIDWRETEGRLTEGKGYGDWTLGNLLNSQFPFRQRKSNPEEIRDSGSRGYENFPYRKKRRYY